MENCLVTTLKGSVDNQNLPVFGKAKVIQINNSKGFQVGMQVGGSVKIKANKSFDVSISGVITTVPAGVDYTVNNTYATAASVLVNAQSDNTTFYIDKYGYEFMSYDRQGADAAVNVNLEDLTFMSKISIQGTNSIATGHVKLSDFKNVNYLRLYPGSNDSTASIVLDIANADLSTIQAFSLNTNVAASGNINGMSAPLLELLEINHLEQVICNVETLNLPSLISLITTSSTGITGDLKVWALSMWNSGNGRTSGMCKIAYIDSHGVKSGVTWDGQDLHAVSGTYTPYIHFSASGVAISDSTTPPESFISA